MLLISCGGPATQRTRRGGPTSCSCDTALPSAPCRGCGHWSMSAGQGLRARSHARSSETLRTSTRPAAWSAGLRRRLRGHEHDPVWAQDAGGLFERHVGAGRVLDQQEIHQVLGVGQPALYVQLVHRDEAVEPLRGECLPCPIHLHRIAVE